MSRRKHEFHSGFSHDGTRKKKGEIPEYIDNSTLCIFQLLGRIG